MPPTSRVPTIVLGGKTPEEAGTDSSRTLAEYIRELVRRLGRREPGAVERMRRVVGSRTARIRLDDETAEVKFEDDRLVVRPAASKRQVQGEGETDTETVLSVLRGEIKVNDAILGGRLRVRGPMEDVARMFVAIAILLDGSARVPELRSLADDFRRAAGHWRATAAARRSRPSSRSTFADPVPHREQLELLDDLGLLP